jgi:glycogen(starch) synthase
MRVLMVSWEYPPVMVGGLGRHVHDLARRMAADGADVVVLCREPAGSDASTHPGADEIVEGVRVLRVPEDPVHLTFERDLVGWTLGMGHGMLRAGYRLLRDWRPDVVHAHDWLVTHPAIGLAEAAEAPLVATIHATEAGRRGGWLNDALSRQIHSVEWWLANHADLLITCSASMRREVAHLFEVDIELVSVLHNGIEPSAWSVRSADTHAARARYREPGKPLLVFFGRLEWEKGVQDLIAALPRARRAHPGTRLVVAGGGQRRAWLQEQARKRRVARSVTFTGALPRRELAAVVSAADAVVLPSRYEPFGIAALEAAAAGVPLVAANVGGLGEFVVHGRTGLLFTPGDVGELADAVCSVLARPAAAWRRAAAAKARLASDFNWATITAATLELYRRARRRRRELLARPKIPTGNVLEP